MTNKGDFLGEISDLCFRNPLNAQLFAITRLGFRSDHYYIEEALINFLN